MKKILFCIDTLGGGGAEKVLVDILNNLDLNKYKIDLLVLTNEGMYFDKINNLINIRTIFPSTKFYKKLSYYLFKFLPANILYKLFIHSKFDVEIAFLEGKTTKLISGSNNKKSKKISWVHIDMLKKHWTKKLFRGKEEVITYDRFSDIIFVSEDAKKSFSKLFVNNRSEKKVIYNPVLPEEIEKKSNEFTIAFEEFTVVSVGRLSDQKGYDRLIKAHSELVGKYPHKLIILGEGQQRDELENLIKSLEVNNSVELKGFMNNPYPYIKSADLYVSSSRTEGYPLVLLEAIALEKPILATNITGAREILSDGLYGVLCADSTEGLKKGIKELYLNRENLEYYKQQSSKKKKQLNYKEIIIQIENLFE